MYDAIHCRATHPPRLFDCTSLRTPVPDALVIGQRMADGTVYAGVSPDTGRAMYTTSTDSGLCGTWNKAMDYAANLDTHRHSDWRVPSRLELNELFAHRAAIGNFNETGWYWSSSQYNDDLAWSRRFSDGYRLYRNLKSHAASLRCVGG